MNNPVLSGEILPLSSTRSSKGLSWRPRHTLVSAGEIFKAQILSQELEVDERCLALREENRVLLDESEECNQPTFCGFLARFKYLSLMTSRKRNATSRFRFTHDSSPLKQIATSYELKSR